MVLNEKLRNKTVFHSSYKFMFQKNYRYNREIMCKQSFSNFIGYLKNIALYLKVSRTFIEFCLTLESVADWFKAWVN